MWRANATILVVLCGYGNLCGFMVVDIDPRTKQMYIHQEPENGGWGAGPHSDWENALIFL